MPRKAITWRSEAPSSLGTSTFTVNGGGLSTWLNWSALNPAPARPAVIAACRWAAWRMDSTQGFHAIMSVFLLPMWLLSGAFFPMDVGGWLGWIIRINPLTYGVAGLRHYLQNVDAAAAHLPSPAVCWIVSLVFAGLILAADCWIAGKRTTGDLL